MILAAVVLGLPALERHRLVLAHGFGRQPAFERRQINERLERRARLTLGGDRAVELAFGIISAADHGAHRALGRDRDKRALRHVELLPLQRKLIGERLLGGGLQGGIDRGLDDQVLLHAADEVIEHVHDPIGHVVERARARGFNRVGGLRERGLGHGLRHEAKLRHRREHRACPALGAVGIAARRQARGRFHHAGEHRGFGDFHLARRLSEISLRSGLDPIGAGAEIDPIEIKLEDFRLAESAFEPERQYDFLHLAPERALLG